MAYKREMLHSCERWKSEPVCVSSNLPAISGLSLLFTFEEKNAFASKSFKDFITPVKEVLERLSKFPMFAEPVKLLFEPELCKL